MPLRDAVSKPAHPQTAERTQARRELAHPLLLQRCLGRRALPRRIEHASAEVTPSRLQSNKVRSISFWRSRAAAC